MDLTILRLENFWLPLIWTICAGLIFNMLPKAQMLIAGRVENRWYWVNAMFVALPLIVWAGTRGYYGDTAAYSRHFYQAPSSLLDLPAYLEKNGKDKGFSVLMVFSKFLGIQDHLVFFLIIAAIQMLFLVHTFRKYSNDYWICIFLFVASTDYISWMFNGMRQFLAATLIFCAFDLMVQKKHILFCLVVMLASTIHGSALLMIPLAYIMHGPALNRKTILMIFCVVLIIPFIDSFMPFLNTLLSDTQYSDITTDEVWTTDDGTNIIRVLVYSVPALIALLGKRYIVQSTNPVMNLCINASVITMVIYLVSSVTSGIYIGRLPIYTTLHGYIALPWMIDQIFEKQTAMLIKLMMIGCYIAFYYFQMGITWGML